MKSARFDLDARHSQGSSRWETLQEIEDLKADLDAQQQHQEFADCLLLRQIQRLEGLITRQAAEIKSQAAEVASLRPPVVRGIPNDFAGMRYMGFPCASCGLMVWTTADSGAWRNTCPKCKTPCVYPIAPPNV